MSDSNKQNPETTNSAAEQPTVSTSRRKFAKASLLATPVLLTVASKPVWANSLRKCSVSVLMSGNQSIETDWLGCRTCSPGYWQNWKACWISAGMDSYKQTSFGTFFGISTTGFEDKEVEALEMGLHDLVSQTADGNNKFIMFARACTASYLNARALGHLYPQVTIPTESQITSMIAEVFNLLLSYPQRKDLAIAKKDALQQYYEEGYVECILPNNGDCPSSNYYTKP